MYILILFPCNSVDRILYVVLSEKDCAVLFEQSGKEEIPDACMKYASIKAKLENSSADPFAGMGASARGQVKQAQIKRRMSTKHGEGPAGKKSSWF